MEEGSLHFSFGLKTKLAPPAVPRIGALVCCCEWLVWRTIFLKVDGLCRRAAGEEREMRFQMFLYVNMVPM